VVDLGHLPEWTFELKRTYANSSPNLNPNPNPNSNPNSNPNPKEHKNLITFLRKQNDVIFQASVQICVGMIFSKKLL